MYDYCKLSFSKEFENENSKQAYLSACKWLAKNIYSKVELATQVMVKIIKKKECRLPTFTVKVYACTHEEEMKNTFCNQCKMLHTVFYSIDSMDCNTCKANGYFKKEKEYIDNKADFISKILEDK